MKDRIEGFLSRKAQDVWPTALVVRQAHEQLETYLLKVAQQPDIILGLNWHEAKQGLLALLHAERAKNNGHNIKNILT